MLAWDDLRFVLSVHRKRTLAAAARELGVDKATVSRRIAAVESSLGARIFDRTGGGYVLSERGRRVVGMLEGVERAVAAVEMELEGEEERAAGTVRVTMPMFFAEKVVIPALGEFHRQHPNITVITQTTSALLDLARREADVAIRNVKPEQGDWVAKRLFRLGIAAYASREYLARRGVPRTPDELGDVIRFDGVPLAPGFPWLENCGQESIRVTDSLSAYTACAAGLGVAVMPCVLAEPSLVRLQLGFTAADIFAVVHRSLHRTARVRAFVGFLAELCSARRDALAGD